MLGDQQDMLWRMKQVLPLRWFPDDTPILDLALSGVAWGWSWVYGLLQQAKTQARIGTAQGIWLDLIAVDYFGARLPRRNTEPDEIYRVRIQSELIRIRGTRQALIASLVDTTARVPLVFEPANSMDTGGYGGSGQSSTGLAYGSSGGWGSLALPFQLFVTAYRPSGGGIASVSGWNCCGAGYRQGNLEYANLAMMLTAVTDDDIRAAITGALPTAVVAWTRISD